MVETLFSGAPFEFLQKDVPPLIQWLAVLVALGTPLVMLLKILYLKAVLPSLGSRIRFFAQRRLAWRCFALSEACRLMRSPTRATLLGLRWIYKGISGLIFIVLAAVVAEDAGKSSSPLFSAAVMAVLLGGGLYLLWARMVDRLILDAFERPMKARDEIIRLAEKYGRVLGEQYAEEVVKYVQELDVIDPEQDEKNP